MAESWAEAARRPAMVVEVHDRFRHVCRKPAQVLLDDRVALFHHADCPAVFEVLQGSPAGHRAPAELLRQLERRDLVELLATAPSHECGGLP